MKTQTKPRKVDFVSEPQDMTVAVLGSLGFSTRAISARLKGALTECQITYRLGRGQIKRADYRNGETAIANAVLLQCRPICEKQILTQVKQALNQ